MDKNVFTIGWWNESLQLNEYSSDQEVIEKIIKGFDLVRFPKGFGNAYTTKNGKATIPLAKRIGKWAKENFPGNRVQIRFEKTFKTINLDLPSSRLSEISDKIANQLIAKFTKENPDLDVNQAKEYIKRFDQIKSNLPVDKRDILKYSWSDLEQTIVDNQSKRTKAGKINDGEPEDANLVYNQNGLRIYVGKTKKACIKYGNGYNFCISSRGEDNLYKDYRYKQGGTPYFVFDDTKTSERDEYGEFIDEEHLLVIFTFNDEDEESAYYSVTTADNPGEDEYFTFGSIEQSYPKLKGLKDIFKHVGIDPKEKAELKLEKKYDGLIGSINESYGNIGGKNYQEDFWNTSYVFETIQTANNRIDDIINGKLTPYNFIGKVKPEVPGKYVAASMSQIRVLKVGSNIQDEKRKFADEVLANLSYDEDVTVEEALNDWEIKAIQKSAPKEYIEEVKQLVDEYRKELAKLKLMKEGLESKPQRLTESQTATIGEFIKYACKDLGIQKLPSRLTLSYDTAAAQEKRSFGYFDPNNNQIWVYVKNRNMADILRTLAHELVHRKQDEDGRIDYESGETGSDIENEANAQAGVLLRDYGKVDNGIYESKEFGDHLFGDKSSGVKIGWYGSEKEPDTNAEKSLFDLLQQYADAEEGRYKHINLDSYYDLFKQIKAEYPDIGDSRLLNNQYIYRGTIVDREKLEKALKDSHTKYNPGKQTIIPDQTYTSRRKISSWSTDYQTGYWFAVNQKLEDYQEDPDKIPVIMRSIVSNAEPYFNPVFMNKLSNTNEFEFLNAAPSMPVEIIVLSESDWKPHATSNNDLELVIK